LNFSFLPIEETIDVFTAARIVGVSMETIRRWSEERRFPAYKIVGRWRIDRRGFFAWLESQKASYR
jgi:excisionase family DNA binding protein